MGDFVFYYGLHNKISKYIKQTKKGCKLYLDDENYINVEMGTLFGQKYITVNFNDSLDFMKFIVKKKIYCDEYKHDYLKYILQNKHYDIIKFYCKKFIPLVKPNDSVFSFFNSLFVDIDLDDFKYIFKYSCLEDIKPHINYILYKADNINIEFMDDIISMYKSKLTKLFTSGKIFYLEISEIEINPCIFLVPALRKDDTNLFDFIMEEICNLTSEIDKTKLNKKRLKLLENFEVEFNSEFIWEIINYYILDDFGRGENRYGTYICPNIFRQLLSSIFDMDSLIDEGGVDDILMYDAVEYMGILCDFIGDTRPEFINKILVEARSTKMAQLLIDYGADYEALYESNEFRKCDSCVNKLVKKIIRETSDS
ncbi:hypothetical protein [Acanthamoeba castellanii mimivirus]|uniref:Uncharacterized protein L179 n=5 Tax=Mimivirus TaxID=315393 RepID=YL179_MIMIV|nr:hypothetical protein MIMI_gp0199 [Acanthamoeba polyphaga mimivirus]Q5UPN6.1 RecName: Full=Uncharacterized protein L179 [Acanthamoeba polyphaga mimivirus]AHJ39952.1 hypothetical protein [Samba virus]ALR83690.1 hypothetical protein [Niemeyer virus]AMZ02627.1 hypothetical protein [Mimivirus Bombay]QTF49083.1 hypothetical protein [Mimivirus reunion]WMV61526.1 hypothetical protein qu_188 [Mimivirus sp.]BAV61267.1 hypothetical protein [Acanthamoeba castellanii mimivirus]